MTLIRVRIGNSLKRLLLLFIIFFSTTSYAKWTFEDIDQLYMHCGYIEVSIHKRLSQKEGDIFCACVINLTSQYFNSLDEYLDLGLNEKKFNNDKRIRLIDRTCNKKIGKKSFYD